MTENNQDRKAEQSAKTARPARRKTIVLSVLFTAVFFLLALLFVIPWAIDYYTDGYSIHQPRRDAQVRSVLWEEPLRFDNRINGQSANYEPTLTADGLTMIFTRGKARHNADLFIASWNGTSWDDPRPLEGVNSPDDELGPELTRDGQYLYFYSNRAGGFGGYDLWVCRKTAEGWSAPENLGDSVNSPFNEYGPGLSQDGGRIFFSSNRLKRTLSDEEKDAWQATLRENFFVGDYDIFSAEIAPDAAAAHTPGQTETLLPPFPQFARATPVAALNSPRDEGQVAVTPRGDFIYFSSNRGGGLGGFDLYRARVLAGAIEEPENMGAPVNSACDDMDPSLYLEGHGLLLSSNRLMRGGDRPFLLFKTVSREVFTDQDWSGLAALLRWLDAMKWLLLLLLLSLLALLWLLRYLASPQFRMHASLLQRCLLASLLLHLLLALLFSTWIVSSGLYDLAGEGMAEVFVDSDALAGERLGIEIREQVAELDAPADSDQFENPSDTLASVDRSEPLEPAEISFEPVRIDTRSLAALRPVPIRNISDRAIEPAVKVSAIDSPLFEQSPTAFEVPQPSTVAAEPSIQPVKIDQEAERLSHNADRAAPVALKPERTDRLDLESPAVSDQESMVATADPTPPRDDDLSDPIDLSSVTNLPPADEKQQPVKIAMDSLQVRERESSRGFESLSAPARSGRIKDTSMAERALPKTNLAPSAHELDETLSSRHSAMAETRTATPPNESDHARSLPEVAIGRLDEQRAAASEIEMEIPSKPDSAERERRERETDPHKAAMAPRPSTSKRRADGAMKALETASRPLPLVAQDPTALGETPPLGPSTPEAKKPSSIELPKSDRQPDLVTELDRFEHGTPRTYHGLEMSSHRVVFCLDISGSMEWNNRIGEARQELLRLLDTLDESVEFNIITFSGRMTIWSRNGLQAGTPDNITSAKRFVRRTRTASDGTNTVGALSLALEDEKVKSIYFLSDGHPTVGYTTENEEILSHVNRQQKGRGVIINTIAYIKGDPPRGWRDQVPPKQTLIELMQHLAEQNDGNYVVFD